MNLNRFAPYDELALSLLLQCRAEGDGAHDVSHIERVWSNAKAIHAEEGGDLEAIAAAVLLHDCVQIAKNSPLRASASRLAAERARVVLQTLEWDDIRIHVVAEAIESHSYSAGIVPGALEGLILQDADRLDAIGLTGIARCFYTAGRMGSALYDPADPQGKQRPLDDLKFALDHFPKKLLLLVEGFKTPAGRRLAGERQRALLEFYNGMLLEIGSPWQRESGN